MGAVWALIVAVLAVWFTKGSGLPAGDTNEISDLSPTEPSIKKVLKLHQSHESVFLKKSKEVRLETNEVEVTASGVYLKVVEHAQNRGRKGSSNMGPNGRVSDDAARNGTLWDDGNTGNNGTLGDAGNRTVGDDTGSNNGTLWDAGNSTVGDDTGSNNATLGDAGNSTVDDDAGNNGTLGDDGNAGNNGTLGDDGNAGNNGTLGDDGNNGTLGDAGNNGTLGDAGNSTVGGNATAALHRPSESRRAVPAWVGRAAMPATTSPRVTIRART
ncbi:circumsporozoite protein-like isoform X2 [Pungitius pungitius]|uniref:circumsporozoite protein-like isoform X2 n=1 Tax=Pungitius pungitius TaxID=134920 RepID=UPI002E158887